MSARWVELLGALESLRSMVGETEAAVARARTMPRGIGDGLREIQWRLVVELRPLVLERLKELAATSVEVARDLIAILERNPVLMSDFRDQATAPERRADWGGRVDVVPDPHGMSANDRAG